MVGPVSSPTPSPWLTDADSGEMGPTPCDALPQKCRTAIVGGGLTGASLAFHLAQRGESCLVLESRCPAGGATGRNGGILWPNPEKPFEMRGVEEVIHTARTAGIACDIRPADWKRFEVPTPIPQADAAPVTPAHGDREARPTAYTMWPAKFVRGLLRSAEPSAQFAIATVLHISAGAAGVVLKTDKGNVACERVILAANGWLGHLLPELKNVMGPFVNQLVITKPLPMHLRPASGSSFVIAEGSGAAEVYGSLRPDGCIVLGGLRSAMKDRAVGWENDGAVDKDWTELLRRWYSSAFPTLAAAAPADRHWVGVLASTKDGWPLAGPVPNWPGVWVCGGYNGHGMPVGHSLARCVVEDMRGAAASLHEVDAEFYKRCQVGRFAENLRPTSKM
eukprot:TRINITY_DN13473_c0_g1_i1.p2 TRINITY_DN13473_c0_g1~~TRINITY_DN13473_c0_g1_i1.p2  ORF type:complete len:392 (-),score=62.69 TRINITY_DN13473_c0_g1_i1:115-1290(-)